MWPRGADAGGVLALCGLRGDELPPLEADAVSAAQDAGRAASLWHGVQAVEAGGVKGPELCGGMKAGVQPLAPHWWGREVQPVSSVLPQGPLRSGEQRHAEVQVYKNSFVVTRQ